MNIPVSGDILEVHKRDANSDSSILRIRKSDILFKSLTICEETHSFINVVFTQSHFAWVPFKPQLLIPFLILLEKFISYRYQGIEWSQVKTIELECRHPYGEKIFRVIWTTKQGKQRSINLTRIEFVNSWIRAINRVGFSPSNGDSIHLGTFRWYIYNYFNYIWIVFLFLCSILLFHVCSRSSIFLCFILSVIAPFWFLINKMIRRLYPKGIHILFQRYDKHVIIDSSDNENNEY
jgi:hypothetical protein